MRGFLQKKLSRKLSKKLSILSIISAFITAFISLSVVAMATEEERPAKITIQRENHQPEGGNLFFGQVQINTSRWEYARIQAGSQPLVNVRVYTWGSGFYSWDDCPRILQPNQICYARIEFRPVYENYHNGTTELTADNGRDSLWLSGIGVKY